MEPYGLVPLDGYPGRRPVRVLLPLFPLAAAFPLQTLVRLGLTRF
jgi:hypothetical protein